MRVLIVDDEQDYLELIGDELSARGYVTETAASGRQALDVGTRFRPDLLVTDWMLKDDIHGLHLISTLNAAFPDMKAILMTGFASDDLRTRANDASVYDFVEKPFEVGRLLATMQEIGASEAQLQKVPSLAMIEIDTSGAIVFANARAEAMMDEAPAGRDAASLQSLFPSGTVSDLDVAIDRWIAVSPHHDQHEFWHLRSQEPLEDGSRLIILVRPDDPHYLDLARIEMLLGIRDYEHSRWPFDERVLVVDDDELLRKCVTSMLESIGAGCYAVETPAEAIRLLENDKGLRFVILDFEMADTHPRSTVERIRAVRPDAVIVGSSGADHRADFAEMGVEHYLKKPWQVDDLLNLLPERL